METWLQKNLARLLPWLDLGTPQLLAEFSAHLGWSFAVPAAAGWLFGHVGVYAGATGWLLYSVVKELIEDGHGYRLVTGNETPEEERDLFTDLFSRCLPAAILLAVEALR